MVTLKTLLTNALKKIENNIHLLTENVPTVEKKRLLPVLPYLEIISLEIRTKLQQALRVALICCQLEFGNKCQIRLSISKVPIPKDFLSSVVYKFQCSLCNEAYYDKSIRHLNIRFWKHIGVSPLTEKKVKPSNNNVVFDHLLYCNFLTSFDNISNLAHENKK